jgi:hypothetical protein
MPTLPLTPPEARKALTLSNVSLCFSGGMDFRGFGHERLGLGIWLGALHIPFDEREGVVGIGEIELSCTRMNFSLFGPVTLSYAAWCSWSKISRISIQPDL